MLSTVVARRQAFRLFDRSPRAKQYSSEPVEWRNATLSARMTYYLLKWNPGEWPVESFADFFDKFERGEPLRWSCGTTKRITPSDRFFLMKSGSQGRGIIGSGEILSVPYSGKHYKPERAAKGDEQLYVDVKFDYLVKPGGGGIPIRRDELDATPFTSNVWDVQGSGKSIPDDVARELANLWKRRVEVSEFSLPDEVDLADAALAEGALKRVTVNSYERNPEARRRCVNKWGYNCAVCNFQFELAYGAIGKNYIHVHHLKPLASIGAAYVIDPVQDLRPVCPNCHAMLHAKSPPLSIEELRDIVARYRSSR
jgi:5-methylcytosine-specific restriction enzyme A